MNTRGLPGMFDPEYHDCVCGNSVASATSTTCCTHSSWAAAVGSAALGAILSTRLTVELTAHLGRLARGIDPALLRGSPDQIATLSPRVQAGVVDAFAGALSTVFLAGVPIAIVAFVIVCFLPELPLRTRMELIDSEPAL